MNRHKTRAEKREEIDQKAKTAPRGGTRAGQAANTAVRRGYAGLPKGLKIRVYKEKNAERI
ncbi:hypothetical protein HY623_00230 [Candidatus Uhrbacteria bacterium]|nr:hypothetical protein [Candidatus Uhrbacteria bacterium]